MSLFRLTQNCWCKHLLYISILFFRLSILKFMLTFVNVADSITIFTSRFLGLESRWLNWKKIKKIRKDALDVFTYLCNFVSIQSSKMVTEKSPKWIKIKCRFSLVNEVLTIFIFSIAWCIWGFQARYFILLLH